METFFRLLPRFPNSNSFLISNQVSKTPPSKFSFQISLKASRRYLLTFPLTLLIELFQLNFLFIKNHPIFVGDLLENPFVLTFLKTGFPPFFHFLSKSLSFAFLSKKKPTLLLKFPFNFSFFPKFLLISPPFLPLWGQGPPFRNFLVQAPREKNFRPGPL